MVNWELSNPFSNTQRTDFSPPDSITKIAGIDLVRDMWNVEMVDNKRTLRHQTRSQAARPLRRSVIGRDGTSCHGSPGFPASIFLVSFGIGLFAVPDVGHWKQDMIEALAMQTTKMFEQEIHHGKNTCSSPLVRGTGDGFELACPDCRLVDLLLLTRTRFGYLYILSSDHVPPDRGLHTLDMDQ